MGDGEQAGTDSQATEKNLLRILHVIDTAMPGGAQAVIAAQVRFSPPGWKHGIIVLNGAKVTFTDALPLLPDRMNIPFPQGYFGRGMRAVYAFIQAFQPDVINLNLQMAYLFHLMVIRRKYPASVVNLSVHALPSQIGIHWFYLIAGMRQSVCGYTVEDAIAHDILLRLGVSAVQIQKIPLGTDFFESEKKSTSEAPYGIVAGPVFLNVARMVRGKGQSFLLKAFAHYRKRGGSGTLVIVGYGVLEKRLRQLASRLSLTTSVVFAGKKMDLAPYYQFADVYVSSSIDEGMGVVVYDAMAAGLPVTGFDAGSLSEIVTNGTTGILVENRSVEKLAEAMKLLTRDAGMRRRMGEAARELISSSYRSSLMAHSYAAWFEELYRKKHHVPMAL